MPLIALTYPVYETFSVIKTAKADDVPLCAAARALATAHAHTQARRTENVTSLCSERESERTERGWRSPTALSRSNTEDIFR